MFEKLTVWQAVFIMLILGITSTVSAQAKWQNIASGLEYKKIPVPHISQWGVINAYRVNLSHYQLRLAFAKDYDLPATSVRHLANRSDAILAINGGFFTPEHKLLGLRIDQGKQYSPIKNISWWGVFYTQNNKATITSKHHFQPSKSIDFAIQSGPRLLVNGNILKLKPGKAERTALAIDRQGHVIIAVTQKAPMTTTEFATILRASEAHNGLNAVSALNLDGGHSTQLYVNLEHFKQNIIGYSAITDAVYIQARKNE